MGNESDPTQLIRDLNQINYIQILLVLLSVWILTKLIERYIPKIADRLPGKMRLTLLPMIPVLRLVIIAVSLIIVVPQIINPTFESLIAILGAAGLAIGFAFKDYISSLIAGIVTIYERPYRPGDWVEIDGIYGEVKSIGMRALKLITPDDTVALIPHQYIWTGNVKNSNDGARDLMCVVNFYIQPNHDPSLVRQKLQDVAISSPYIQLERPISVVVAELPGVSHYRLKAYPIDSRDQFQFISDLTERGKLTLARIGIKAAEFIPDFLQRM